MIKKKEEKKKQLLKKKKKKEKKKKKKEKKKKFLPSDCSISSGNMQQNFARTYVLEHRNSFSMGHSL